MSSAQFDQQTRFLIDFQLTSVPALVGLDVPSPAAASILGVREDDLRTYLSQAEQCVRSTATELLAQPELASVIDQWPVSAGGSVMTVGDSITIHRYGYAEILRRMFALRRPADEIHLVNVAQSGYTSADGLLNTYTQYLSYQPDWAFIMYGCNDCKRLDGNRTLVSITEYRNNVADIVRAFQRHSAARIVLLTPTPVVEPMIDSDPDFQAARLRWDNRDLAACAQAVQELGNELDVPVIDTFSAISNPNPAVYVEDGLHPNAEGQRIISTYLIRALMAVF
ncbi:MAG: hypothetical protein GX620_12975 [Chloroflexi bacterium]|nr:hypothetical protein [Chloroflexota bacterium]